MTGERPIFAADRGSIQNWWAERKMEKILLTLRLHFKETFKVEPKETGDTLEDFVVVKLLGFGSSGLVKLVKHRRSVQLSALKIVDSNKNVRHPDVEIKTMSSVVHPFIASLRGHFRVGPKLYLEMPYYGRRDLFSLLQTYGKCHYPLACFYAAQLVMGIDFLHSVGVVHRDLKPENVMIEEDGYVRIVDFGLSAKTSDDRLYTICGTPTFMAPEMYRAQRTDQGHYDKSVDWWSFGVIMFQVITGTEPFAKENTDLQIMCCNVGYPPELERASKRFLRGFLQEWSIDRLGCRKRGVREVMDHPWFSGVDWPGLFFKKVKAPYIPEFAVECGLTEGVKNGDGGGKSFCIMEGDDFAEF